MTKESVKQLFTDQLRELADEGAGRIEREAREDFAEHLRPLIMEFFTGSENISLRDEINNTIDSLLEEMAED